MGPKQQMTQVTPLLTLCPQTNRFQINLFTSSDIQNSYQPVHRVDKFSDQRIRYTDLTDLQINRLQINRLQINRLTDCLTLYWAYRFMDGFTTPINPVGLTLFPPIRFRRHSYLRFALINY